jgi:hypothetical protein
MCQICELLDDPAMRHTHTILPDGYGGMPVHDQGAAYLHRQFAREKFWERIRVEVKSAVREALTEEDPHAVPDAPTAR